MAVAIDGTAHVQQNATPASVTLTTTSSNDYVIVAVTTNGGPVVSVASANLTFTRMAAPNTGTAAQTLEIWYAFAASALVSEVITVTTSFSQFTTIDAFGVSGSGQTSAVFDAGGPQSNNGASDPISITTTNANTMVVAAFRFGAVASPTAGATFTAESGANFQLVEYKVLSATATQSCTVTTGAGNSNAQIAFAIVQATTAVTGTLGATEAQDIAAFAGSFSIPSISGVLAAIEIVDLAAMAGTVQLVPAGILAVSENMDLAQITMTFLAPPPQAGVPYPAIQDYGWKRREPPVPKIKGRRG